MVLLCLFYIYFIYLFFFFFFYFIFFFWPIWFHKRYYKPIPLLILQLMDMWRTVTNVSVVAILLCAYLYFSVIITNARNGLVDNFIEYGSFIIASLCLNLLQKLKTKAKRKVQGVPQSQTAALPRH